MQYHILSHAAVPSRGCMDLGVAACDFVGHFVTRHEMTREITCNLMSWQAISHAITREHMQHHILSHAVVPSRGCMNLGVTACDFVGHFVTRHEMTREITCNLMSWQAISHAITREHMQHHILSHAVVPSRGCMNLGVTACDFVGHFVTRHEMTREITCNLMSWQAISHAITREHMQHHILSHAVVPSRGCMNLGVTACDFVGHFVTRHEMTREITCNLLSWHVMSHIVTREHMQYHLLYHILVPSSVCINLVVTAFDFVGHFVTRHEMTREITCNLMSWHVMSHIVTREHMQYHLLSHILVPSRGCMNLGVTACDFVGHFLTRHEMTREITCNLMSWHVMSHIVTREHMQYHLLSHILVPSRGCMNL